MKKFWKVLIILAIILLVLSIVIILEFFRELSLLSKSKNRIIDDNGIPFTDYKTIEGIYIGKQRNPVISSMFAISYYDDYVITGNETAKLFFFSNADWLVSYSKLRGNYSIYEYEFPWPKYNLPLFWTDGMAQGKAIQVLLKAHELSNDQKYLDEARLLLNAFFVDVKDGGVTYKTEDEGWWYEHYAHKEGKAPRVLNGHIFSLLGIYDYYEYTKDPDAKFLFEQGVIALKKDLSNYDYDGYSTYDAIGNPSRNYHKLHQELLGEMYTLTNEEIFNEYMKKWEKCDDWCQFYHRHMDKFILTNFF